MLQFPLYITRTLLKDTDNITSLKGTRRSSQCKEFSYLLIIYLFKFIFESFTLNKLLMNELIRIKNIQGNLPMQISSQLQTGSQSLILICDQQFNERGHEFICSLPCFGLTNVRRNLILLTSQIVLVARIQSKLLDLR